MVPFLTEYLSKHAAVPIPERFSLFEKLASSRRRPLLDKIQRLSALRPEHMTVDLSGNAPRLSAPEVHPEFLSLLEECVRELIPWRKGPFHLFGIDLDAEWRSDWKWDRLQLSEQEVRGKRVADVGCGNGYYMLRLASANPSLVVGFDPTDRYLTQYLLIRSLIPDDLPLVFEPLRGSALEYYPEQFDLMLCMGVLYHHPQPAELLRELYNALAPNGILYLETLFTPEGESLNIDNHQTYANMRNVYQIPSRTHLESLLQHAGFRNGEPLSALPLSTEEQRRTEFAPGKSLIDFLDPADRTRTVEGFIRPHRTIYRAIR